MTQQQSKPEFGEPFYDALLELHRLDTDWTKYVALLEAGSRAGDDHASYALSSMYLHGFDELKWSIDVRSGLRLLRRASRSVHLAMVELAMYYEGGDLGLRSNRRKAFDLFAKAVKYGSVVGRYHLGRCYYYGVGTRPNRTKAMALFRVAAGLGFPVYENHELPPDEAPTAAGDQHVGNFAKKLK